MATINTSGALDGTTLVSNLTLTVSSRSASSVTFSYSIDTHFQSSSGYTGAGYETYTGVITLSGTGISGSKTITLKEKSVGWSGITSHISSGTFTLSTSTASSISDVSVVYRVTSSADSTHSNTGNTTIDIGAGATACGAPTTVSLQSYFISGTSVTVSWSGATAGSGNAISGYQIWINGSQVTTVSTTATSGSYIISGKTNTFYVQIKTVGSAGSSYYSGLTTAKYCTKNTAPSSVQISFSNTTLIDSVYTILSTSNGLVVNSLTCNHSDSQTLTYYYSLNNGAWTSVSTGTEISLSSTSAVSFRIKVNDTLEDSAIVTYYVRKNLKPKAEDGISNISKTYYNNTSTYLKTLSFSYSGYEKSQLVKIYHNSISDSNLLKTFSYTSGTVSYSLGDGEIKGSTSEENIIFYISDGLETNTYILATNQATAATIPTTLYQKTNGQTISDAHITISGINYTIYGATAYLYNTDESINNIRIVKDSNVIFESTAYSQYVPITLDRTKILGILMDDLVWQYKRSSIMDDTYHNFSPAACLSDYSSFYLSTAPTTGKTVDNTSNNIKIHNSYSTDFIMDTPFLTTSANDFKEYGILSGSNFEIGFIGTLNNWTLPVSSYSIENTKLKISPTSTQYSYSTNLLSLDFSNITTSVQKYIKIKNCFDEEFIYYTSTNDTFDLTAAPVISSDPVYSSESELCEGNTGISSVSLKFPNLGYYLLEIYTEEDSKVSQTVYSNSYLVSGSFTSENYIEKTLSSLVLGEITKDETGKKLHFKVSLVKDNTQYVLDESSSTYLLKRHTKPYFEFNSYECSTTQIKIKVDNFDLGTSQTIDSGIVSFTYTVSGTSHTIQANYSTAYSLGIFTLDFGSESPLSNLTDAVLTLNTTIGNFTKSYSINFTAVGYAATVCYRKNQVGINGDPTNTSNAFMIQCIDNTKNYVSFKNLDGDEMTINLATGTLAGATFDCGTWD